MENIDEFIMPDVAEKKEAPKKELKKVTSTKERLTRVNRDVVCSYCEENKILNPDQYQLLYDTYGSEEKIASEFMCKGCEMSMKRNPFFFWTFESEIIHELSRKIKTCCDQYEIDKNVLALQSEGNKITSGFGIIDSNFEWIVENQRPIGITIKNFPFVGTVKLKVYEQRKKRIEVVR